MVSGGPTTDRAAFESLVADGASAPLEGWDFSWFEGRATEERPSWGYTGLVVDRLPRAAAVLDIQTGGGEVLAEMLTRAPRVPPVVVATEAYRPNLAPAARRLTPLGAVVVGVSGDGRLPFPDGRFDLVISRHPTDNVWDEIARVLSPGGTYLSQQIGAGSNRELTDWMMGPQPVSDHHRAARARPGAEAAGLEVRDLRQESLRVVFEDIGAVVAFLRKVVWTVPDFTVDRYRGQLAHLHERIRSEGPFVSHAERFLIEATKPDRRPGAVR